MASMWRGSLTWDQDIVPEGADGILRLGELGQLGQRLPLARDGVIALGVGQVEAAHSLTAPDHYDHLREASWPAGGGGHTLDRDKGNKELPENISMSN